MRKLILIKHASPRVDPQVPAHEWTLSDDGRRKCGELATLVGEHRPAIVVTSSESKAIETGRIVADALGVPVETSDGLEEHDRSNVPIMPSREFISFVELFFRERDRLVLGRETASQALRRFSDAIDDVLARHPRGNLAIVTHGTVLALFAAEHADIEPFQFWRRMGLPSFVVFEVPDMRMTRTVEQTD